jgi:hypothetical protein
MRNTVSFRLLDYGQTRLAASINLNLRVLCCLSATLGACPLGAVMVFVDHQGSNIFFQLTAVPSSFLRSPLDVESSMLDVRFFLPLGVGS